MSESKATPKKSRTSIASKPHKSAAKSQSPPKAASKSAATAGAKAQAGNAEGQATGPAASRLIDQRIHDLGGWRGETLARMRALIREADPAITEEWKWRGTPVWSHDGIVCTGEAYTKVVKLTFAQGAKLPDPKQLFNSSLEGNTRRAIDIHEGEKVNASAFKSLIKAAVALNAQPAKKAQRGTRGAKPVKLLSGGNPQIAKADGDAPVQEYIAAMPGWKRALGERLDELIVRSVPNVRKAVKWNSPFYGIEGQGWFLSFHVFTRYVKVTFFAGTSLGPMPPGGTERSKEVRWIDVYEDEPFDEAQMTAWVKQAAAIPGWDPSRRS